MEPLSQHKEGVETNPEISLKDLFLKLGEWGRFLLKKWYIIVLCGILGAALGITYAYFKKTNYVAELTFVMEEGKSSSLGAYAGLASQFGIDVGGGGTSGVFSGENILQFLKTRLMVEKALLTPIKDSGKVISLADLYINSNELRKSWKKDPLVENIHFPTEKQPLSQLQDSILSVIYERIVKSSLTVVKPDKKLGFIFVKCTSPNPVFSKEFTERLVKEAIEFYTITKTKRSKASVDVLQAKADSLELLLNKKTYAVAASQDLNLNPARRIALVGAEVGARDKLVLQTMYGEVVKNLEMSKIAMAQETPLIQLVDMPRYPLMRDRLSKFKGMIFGGLVLGFLACAFLIARKIFNEIMQ
ncbi:GumC domain-containing protein [Chitinophaga flava]|uniref:Lipopolysaccharide biosynthesis protein n=1 Tax=Chitinophaga flava TaxID=2259036 RepID=A0A365Y5L2_9BACT|nr:lipopolysaccharide biosynthesis protein [Chitinophaga flava]RBL93799.1 lipopolysaccharide biosynthesis protein [Chitinophaga flava]